MNIQTQITPHKPTYYDRSTQVDWTIQIERGGVCLFEGDCTLTVNYWPYEVAQVRMGDDFGYEIDEIKFSETTSRVWIEHGDNGYWATEQKSVWLTPKSDAPLFALLVAELSKRENGPKLKAAIAAKIEEDSQ